MYQDLRTNTEKSSPDSFDQRSLLDYCWNMPTLSRGATFSRDGNSKCCHAPPDVASVENTSADGRTKDVDDERTRQHSAQSSTSNTASEYSGTDLELESDHEEEKARTEGDPFGIKEYLRSCEKLGILPIRRVLNDLPKKELHVRNRSMTDLDIEALCNALTINRSIVYVYLDGNAVGKAGTEHLAELLLNNVTITKLHVSGNCIGSEGVNNLLDVMVKNQVVSSLNLAGNTAKDITARPIANLLKMSKTLFRLNLSYNELSDDACKILAPFIASNCTMRVLDLSWNRIQTKGSVELFRCLKENTSIMKFRISMNGLADGGAIAFSQCLLKNTSLTEVDISQNRISNQGASHIARALSIAVNLKKLTMHDNPVTANGLMSILTAMKRNTRTGVAFLDISPVPVHGEAFQLLTELRNKNKRLLIKHGIRITHRVSISNPGQKKIENRDPLIILKEYISAKGYRLIDFFKQFDKDGSGAIDRKEFVAGIKSINVPLSVSQLDLLINRLDKDGNGEIDFQELYLGDQELRQKERTKRMRQNTGSFIKE